MTCETVRDHLLELDTDRFVELDDHLRRCPGCAELAAAIRATEHDLRQHLEDFVTTQTLDAQWATALEQAGAPPRRWPLGLHSALLALATAAVITVALLPHGPPPPAPPPSATSATIPAALLEIREATEAFEAIETHDLPVDGLSRAGEDQLLRETLSQKATALVAVEASLLAFIEDPDQEPRWQIQALHELGDVYRAMGDALIDFTTPTYLAPNQLEVYTSQIELKARAQWDKAIETYALATDRARDQEQPEAATAAQAAADELQQLLDRRDRTAERERQAATAQASRDGVALQRLSKELRASLASCPGLEASRRGEAEALLEEAQLILSAGEASMYGGLLELMVALEPSISGACGG